MPVMKKMIFHCLLLLAAIPLSARDQHKKDSTGSPINQLIEKAVQIGKKDTTAAALIFLDAIAKAQKDNNLYLTGKAFYEMGQMYFAHKNHNHSFGSYFNAREYFVKAGARKETAHTLFGMGRQQYLRGNYKVAAGHLNFAMREARLLKLHNLESDALEYLGLLYHVMPGTDQKSIAHFKRSYQIKSTLKDRKGMLRMLQKLGDVYYQQKYFDSALQCIQQSIDMAGVLGLDHDVNISRLDKAGTLIRMNKMKEADHELRYIAFEADTSDFNIRLRYNIQKANYLTAQKKYEAGRNNYDMALVIANQIGVPEMYAMVYKQMAEAYSDQGLYKEAYGFSQQYNAHLTGYYTENVNTIRELEYIFNTSLTKDEIAYLNSENSLKARLLQNERKLSTVLLTGTAVLLLLAVVIFYLYRKQKNTNSIIKKQADELHTLMQEIHHRVKNNLQIISSLLDLQSTHITDNQAALAIKESRNRVNSMALIHQHLYGEKNIQNIAIDEYITNLAQNLFHSYNIQPGQVTLHTDIEKLKLDIDTVIPLGLMLNELISNSLKHAFVNTTGGRIDVTLQKNKDVLFLQVKDNGKGFARGTDPAHPGSFGMRMIRIFAQKLKADLDMNNEQGACVTMRIHKFTMNT
jgi:two-component sensor histidine kinase